ncbi:hypothetical protein K443DRAFT_686373 [Laccaria amethystina LaAM-08-1]|uniref:Cleavage stimulation factor subunit 2 hinge domain-containing protein n=1 Tax=Laccaria amethystina LaAM-08-1 TaxID=1095629 RepID=A0A0C9X366_9AGAR|nr:hypothetical protein K443DRAFT_686373 [Laccaria amethystina LaAM-08-1]
MSNANMATEQLLELLLTLKKTTPTAARGILNSQPAIAYALISLMVSMNAIDVEVFKKTLAEFGSSVAQAAPTGTTLVAPLSVPQTPASAIPPHMQQQQPHSWTSTPPSAVPPVMPPQQQQSYAYVNGQQYYGVPAPRQAYGFQGYLYHEAQAAYPGYPSTYGAPQPPPQASQTPVLPDTLAAIPDDQKALIMRVLSVTPEQINMLPAAERTTYIQIRTTLSVPTG